MHNKILIIHFNEEQKEFFKNSLSFFSIIENSDDEIDLIITAKLDKDIFNNVKLKYVPIIFLAQNSLILEEALDFKVNDYIIWPTTSEDIRARVKIQLSHKKLQTKLLDFDLDGLTGVFNKNYFNNKINDFIEDAHKLKQPLSLIMIDLDFFKNINETYGHLAGDEVLKQIAQLIKSEIRFTDLLTRFGGEEFALLLPNTSLENAALVAERIRNLIYSTSYKIPFNNIKISNTASFGISCLNATDSVESLIERADKALYKAKSLGKNKVTIL